MSLKLLVKLTALTLTLASINTAAASDSCDSTKIINRFSVEAGVAGIPPTSSFFKGDNLDGKRITVSSTLHLKYGFSFAPATVRGRWLRGSYQGIGLGVNTFNPGNMLGVPVSAYVYQGAPFWHITPKLSLGYEWQFGASFGWKKNNELTDPQNIVGSHTNAYINLGLRLDYRLRPDLSLVTVADGSHFSNGNTSQPNSGVNTIGVRFGVVYTPDACGREYDLEPLPDFRRGISYDLLLYGAWRRRIFESGGEKSLLPGKFGVAGISFAPMYDVCRLFRAGLSLDVQYDESSGLRKYKVDGSPDSAPLFYRPPFMKSVSAGLSARAEFVMPVFSVAVGFGRNVLGPSDSRHFYQTLNLKAYVMGDLFLNVGYQLHDFKSPNNLMLGFGYRFNSSH